MSPGVTHASSSGRNPRADASRPRRESLHPRGGHARSPFHDVYRTLAAGAASHPAWYVNLARRPDGAAVEVDGRRVPVSAESLHGAERERAWARIVALAPGYGKYAEQTDREIPVVRLTPRRCGE